MMTIGGVRTLKAVIQDVISISDTAILAIDISILTIFIIFGVLIYLEKIRRFPLVVGVLLVVLLIFSYVQFGGVRGASEYNLMALGVLLALAYRERELVWVLGFYLGLILIANFDLYFNGWLTRNFFKEFSVSHDNYITTWVTVLLMVLYFKNTLAIESNRMLESRLLLNDQASLIQRQHDELTDQQQQLSEVNKGLEGEIRKHTDHIVKQNKVIEDYIWLATESLDAPLKNICKQLDGLRENNFLEVQLKDQVAQLRMVIYNLKNELHQNGTDGRQ